MVALAEIISEKIIKDLCGICVIFKNELIINRTFIILAFLELFLCVAIRAFICLCSIEIMYLKHFIYTLSDHKCVPKMEKCKIF